MPKMKSRRGVMKRFTRTGSGRVKRSRACASHLMTAKSRKRKRKLRKSTLVSRADEKSILTMMA